MSIKKTSTMYRIILITCVSMLLVNCSNGFKKPEDAINNFFSGIIKKDLDKTLKSFAIENKAKYYNIENHKKIGFIHPDFYFPAQNNFYISLNIMQEKAYMCKQIRRFITGILLPPELTYDFCGNNKPINIYKDSELYNIFYSSINLDKIKQIKLLKIKTVSVPSDEQEQVKLRFKNEVEWFNADEITEKIALFDYEGTSYVMGFSLIRYNNDWFISELSAKQTLGYGLEQGLIKKMTEGEFNNL